MKAYSADLRQKIVQAYDRGLGSQEHVAQTFGVSLSFVEKLLRRRRRTGRVAPLAHGGGRRRILDQQAQQELRAVVRQQPDATLAELREVLSQKRGLQMSVATVSYALRRLGLAYKKTRMAKFAG
ncbi:MAG TPA: IS630 transposase-related protein [Candidatus Methylomirabilis sp.]